MKRIAYSGTLAGLLLVSFFTYKSFFAHPSAANSGRLIVSPLREEDEEEMEEKEKSMTDQERYAYLKARWKYEYDMLKDPGTGVIPHDIREKEFHLAKHLPAKQYSGPSGIQGTDNLNNYIAAGPDSIGGRTRAVMYDRRYNGTSNRVILAGSVSGGIFRSSDGGANWNRVNPENDIHNLTTLAQDPRSGQENTWYAAGGEAVGNSTSEDGAAYLSFGVWKSTDNGLTWTKLTLDVTDINGSTLPAGTLEQFDNPFDFVHRIIVNPVNGDVYVAAHRRLIRSTDGGASWNVVFSGTKPAGSGAGQMDIACTTTGTLYLAVNGGLPDRALRGVWTSTSGAANSWVHIAGGKTLGVDSVAGWRANAQDGTISGTDTTYSSRRILLAIAPSNEKIIYVTYENGLSQDGASPKPEADLFKLDVTSGANVWADKSANMPDFPGDLSGVDPFELQEGYNLTLTVKPDDPNVVFLGGTSLFRSTDGFSTTPNTSWIAGYSQDFASGLKLYPGSHPDIHNLVFMPNNGGSNPGFLKGICANDGGIQQTDNIMATGATNPVAWKMIRNYQTLQYFHVGIDPKATQMNFIGGAQDNGTQVRVDGDNTHIRIVSGDGGAAAIGKITSTQFTLYGSAQLGDIYRYQQDNDFKSIRPSGLTAFPGIPDGFGDFVTYFKMDFDNQEDIYYANFNRLFRTKAASTVTSSTWEELTGVRSKVNPTNPSSGTNISIRAMDLSRGPYFPSHVLYIGTSNGKVFRLNDPRNALANASPVDITPPDLETLRAAGTPVNISDISINPNNDEEIMVVVSNYSVTSGGTTKTDFNIWWTNSAKSATPIWRKAEGNLTLPSIRSCQIVVKKNGNTSTTEYYVGTSVGLYSATDIGSTLQSGGTVNWVREGGNVLNFAVVTSLDYRPQDNVLVVGTHGNGLYYAELGNPDYHPNQNTPVDEPIRNDKNFILRAYPTLTNSKINYFTGNMFTIKKMTVTVNNIAGQLMYKKVANYENGQVDVTGFASGAYILTITSADNKQQFVSRFVKQ
jgi:hypothetical protein